MIFVIDIGNTNVVIGGMQGTEVVFTARLSTNHRKTALEYAIDIQNILDIYKMGPSDFEGGIISSVVPQITDVVKEAAEALFGWKLMVLSSTLDTGLTFKVDQPGALGADRLADTVAAAAEYPLPVMVIDMGTATTMSVIDENRCFLGGAISPGVKISLEALTDRASKLSGISLAEPESVIGKNTIDCMRSGVLYGSASMIDGMAERMSEVLGKPVTAVATGGLSGLIIPYCKKPVIRDKDLLLKGLSIIYEKNK